MYDVNRAKHLNRQPLSVPMKNCMALLRLHGEVVWLGDGSGCWGIEAPIAKGILFNATTISWLQRRG